MQSYKRKITYFYQYHNGMVGSTAGFMKLEIRGDKVKLIINIQEPMGIPYKEAMLYFYHEAGDHLAAIKVDTIESVHGVLTYQNRTDWQNVFQTERDLYTFDGVAVVYNDTHYYIGDFADKDRRDYALVKKERKPVVARMVPVLEDEPDERMKPVVKIEHEGRNEQAEKSVEIEPKQPVVEIEQPERSEQAKQSVEIEPKQPVVEIEQPERNEQAKQSVEIEPKQLVVEIEQPERIEQAKQSVETEPKQLVVEIEQSERSEQVEKSVEIEPKQPVMEIEQPERSEPVLKAEHKEINASESRESQETGGAFGMCQHCPYQEKRREQQEDVDAFEKMIQNYPKLPMYGATELFDCVRIHPRDIGKLDMRNWKLGVNSFLTHGFYTYQYLLLGKMRFEDGAYRCIIGVPGVFSNREKYLANMFGFDQFIPVKKTNMKTGEFGYWIVEIQSSVCGESRL